MRFYNFISGLFIKVYSAKKYDFSTPKNNKNRFYLIPPPSSKLLEEGYGEKPFLGKGFSP